MAVSLGVPTWEKDTPKGGERQVKDLRQKQWGLFGDMPDKIRREWVAIREAGLCRPCRWAFNLRWVLKNSSISKTGEIKTTDKLFRT